ncbi:hypothetical protein [Mycolicibacterium sp.]|jgi:hypothetical protein|uniref:hypothetical protein n=1 Tax=Mycolicibacterium sp. TaxID=2320850 RepID=UPI0028ACCF3A|nr:hypothetical protein [Mycolicibacterium sp.]
MKPQTRAGTAALAGLAIVGIGLFGLSQESKSVEPGVVLAPATATMDAVTTTTSSVNSFRPTVTATPPPPPLD